MASACRSSRSSRRLAWQDLDDYQPSHDAIDQHLECAFRSRPGPHALGVTFPKKPSGAARNRAPAVPGALQLAPASAASARGLRDLDHRSVRRRPVRATRRAAGGFSCRGRRTRRRKNDCATTILRDADAARLSAAGDRRRSAEPARSSIGEARRRRADFDAGIEMAVCRVLVEPASSCSASSGIPPASRRTRPIASAISSWRRACRSSCGAASRTTSCSTSRRAANSTSRPVLERQVRRMLADRALASAGHQLRRAVAVPAQSRRRSRRTCGCSRISTTTCGRRSGRKRSCSSRASCARTAACSICCSANYTFLNERLAKHYGIPHVYGSRFRRVDVRRRRAGRGGLLRQGSILTVTSYATRTSPVIRGKWILENLLGMPPPPPPPNVPALEGQHRRRQRCRCASGWRSIARTRRARAAIN